MDNSDRSKNFSSRCINSAWDLWCLISIIGIWPRFIEPNLLSVKKINLTIPSLRGLTFLQMSDLHWKEGYSQSFSQKIIKKTKELKPDLIFFTGDFLCESRLEDEKGLSHFLNAFSAPFGCYAILGNHDYESYVSVNANGDYDVKTKIKPPLNRGFQRLMRQKPPTGKVTDAARSVREKKELVKLIENSPFKLLQNSTVQVKVKGTSLNICGLGDYMAGKLDPSTAFKQYQTNFPGVILSHNPDTAPLLKDYPGNIILSGHTHGGEINIPGCSRILGEKLTLLENPALKQGLFQLNDKQLYVNRGLGSVIPFRWFAMPEITLFTL